MLTKHRIHYTTILCKEFICIKFLAIPVTVCNFEYFTKTVRHCLVRSENSEVSFFLVEFEDVSYKSTEFYHILCLNCTRLRNVNSVISEVRKTKVTKKFTTICMWVRTDSLISCRSKCFEFRNKSSVLIKEFFRMIAKEPLF